MPGFPNPDKPEPNGREQNLVWMKGAMGAIDGNRRIWAAMPRHHDLLKPRFDQFPSGRQFARSEPYTSQIAVWGPPVSDHLKT